MRRPIALALLGLLSVSCTIQPPSTFHANDVNTEQSSGPQATMHTQGIEQEQKLPPTEVAEIMRRLRIIETRNKQSVSLQTSSTYPDIEQYSDEVFQNSIPNQLALIVKDRTNLHSMARAVESLGYQVEIGEFDTIRINLPESGKEAIKKHFKIIKKLSGIRMLGPRTSGALLLTTTPNDTYYTSQENNDSKQWPINKINATEAYDYYDIRNSSTKIAIVDTGVDLDHPDLSSKIVTGVDVLNNPDDYNDYFGHGTAVAGIAAAVTNNNYAGIAGAAWGSFIMPVNLEASTRGNGIYTTDDKVRESVNLAMHQGATVINCSFGKQIPHDGLNNYYYKLMVEDALNYDLGDTRGRGIPLICSAGNLASPTSNSIFYPAAYAAPFDPNNDPLTDPYYGNVISVGATDYNNIRAGFSCYGSRLSLVAPGVKSYTDINTSVDLYSTTRDGSYGTSFTSSTNITKKIRGTSIAAPFVTGAFASLWYAGRVLPYWQIRDILYATATDQGSSGWDPEYGHGLLNFGAAADFMLGAGLVYEWEDGNHIQAHTNSATESFSVYQKTAFGTQPTQLTNLLALYRRFNPNNGDRLLTCDPTEGNQWGFQTERIIGYISPPNTSYYSMNYTLHRFVSNDGNKHFYTNRTDEYNAKINDSAHWTYQWPVGRVY